MFYKNATFLLPIIRKFSSTDYGVLSRTDAKNKIISAKNDKQLTFQQISEELEKNKVWLTSAILGEHPFNYNDAIKLLKLIGINDSKDSKSLIQVLTQIPENRGENFNANDPTIARFFELIKIYGPSLKALINEMCGDGIMSAIDCTIDCKKYTVDNNDRIVIIIDGKFLKYKN